MKVLIYLFLALLFATASNPTFAHIPDFDGPIGAIVHVEPNDNPIAGFPSELHFHFKDKKHKFLMENCICTVRVTKGKTVIREDLLDVHTYHNEHNASHIPITFPEKGIYAVTIDGKSTNNSFQPFHLNYSFRVEKTGDNQALVLGLPQQQLTYGIIVAISIGVIGTILISSFSSKKKK